jgi:L-iditol 2-dehydrogenase
LIKRGGKITLVGVSPEPVLELDIASLNAMEGTIYSVYRYRNLYSAGINAVSNGSIPLKSIVSHVFDFKDVIKGVEYNWF